MAPLAPDVLERLARYDSPTICNVIELCGYRPHNTGYLSSRIRSIYPELPPMVGYAVTATFRSGTQPSPHEKSLGLAEQVAGFARLPGPKVMVLKDLDDSPGGAAFGEVMISTYQGFGCVGLITDGLARDILQVRPMNFPCFASGICVSHAYSRLLEAGVPVAVGGVQIRPGDLLHGDANGVTTIPLEIAERVADACEPFVAAENVIISAARTAGTSPEGFAQAVNEFTRQREALSRRLSGDPGDREAGV